MGMPTLSRRALLVGLTMPYQGLSAWTGFRASDLPDARLVDQDSRPRRFLSDVLAQRKAVVIELIFGGCQSICPISTRIMAEAREMLGTIGNDILSVSLTLDPANDTPETLRNYVTKADLPLLATAVSKGDWVFLTGRPREVQNLLSALRLRFGHPDDHSAIFFVGDGRTRSLTRLIALPPVCELAAVMRAAVQASLGAGADSSQIEKAIRDAALKAC
jgi:cytochrome oxidase Cu insertion factor (SCO1/SenC/PrrC family)